MQWTAHRTWRWGTGYRHAVADTFILDKQTVQGCLTREKQRLPETLQ